MNTIKNYLESMFAQLPNTPEVWKAKDELWQMMEDRYTDLIADGKTENEAVGAVIAEFGDLDELAETLGIRGAMNQAPQYQASILSASDAFQLIKDKPDQWHLSFTLYLFRYVTSGIFVTFYWREFRNPWRCRNVRYDCSRCRP